MGGGDRLAFDVAQNLGDFFGCHRTALGQFTHFIGHDGESAAVLAGASGFDRGVEREQVRLIGDVFDRIDDFFDLR